MMSCYLPIDEDTLALTAEALEIINPSRVTADHIRNMIRANMDERIGTYLGTCGWIAFTWAPADRPDDIQIRVAVEPYSVLKYLGKVKT
jgi:hypothetical protein